MMDKKAPTRDEKKAELENAYRERLGDLGDPNVALIVDDLMGQGAVVTPIGAGKVHDQQLRSQAAAHDLVVRILNLAGLTRDPRHLFQQAREARRVKTEAHNA